MIGPSCGGKAVERMGGARCGVEGHPTSFCVSLVGAADFGFDTSGVHLHCIPPRDWPRPATAERGFLPMAVAGVELPPRLESNWRSRPTYGQLLLESPAGTISGELYQPAARSAGSGMGSRHHGRECGPRSSSGGVRRQRGRLTPPAQRTLLAARRLPSSKASF